MREHRHGLAMEAQYRCHGPLLFDGIKVKHATHKGGWGNGAVCRTLRRGVPILTGEFVIGAGKAWQQRAQTLLVHIAFSLTEAPKGCSSINSAFPVPGSTRPR